MQFSMTLIAIMASLAVATPTWPSPPKTTEPTSKGAQAQCGKGQKVSCCNSGVGNALLGANCVELPLLSLIPLQSQCQNNNVVACCNTKQNGLINVNVECIPVNLALL